MGWDPSVLRKYNTTGHFRLLSQLRSELKGNPLVRPKEGQSVGEVNRSKSLIRAIEGRSGGYGRSRRSAPASVPQQELPVIHATDPQADDADGGSTNFLSRLGSVEMR
ncbi:hypothetical protein KBY58_06565 [Cyanobium sp. HWJ4-Hawea]|uniref:hypothetical protein n=1 Tax=Cyanobium sp. HWJ4-Hawea TaxID=2823713 RepID=UPI0020CBA58B|nr:hypothetical protein [Cyanobium sp. HWJ4-Hawea]MCP9809092.1 hypothetical protein [Cyanobium sp. HWJ4-Hawea]